MAKNCLLRHALWMAALLAFGTLQAAECQPETPPGTVYGANPVVSYVLAAMAPERMVGWNFPPPEQARGIFDDRLFNLPVIGGWFGQGRSPNLEQLAAVSPDLTLVSGVTIGTDRSLPVLDRLGLAACEVTLETLDDYPTGFRQIGVALGSPERGEALARHAEYLLAELARGLATRQGEAPRIYYAQDRDGLATECRGSVHAEVIEAAGGSNAFVCPASALENRFGKIRIDFEQLIGLDPDWIVTQEAEFYRHASKDRRWQALTAVREDRILLMPQVPFRWMDRPPSYMRLLAAHWLAGHIYLGDWPLDIASETRHFLYLFFGADLDDSALHAILNPE